MYGVGGVCCQFSCIVMRRSFGFAGCFGVDAEIVVYGLAKFAYFGRSEAQIWRVLRLDVGLIGSVLK